MAASTAVRRRSSAVPGTSTGARVAATAVALPPNVYSQSELAAVTARELPRFQRREGFLQRFFDSVGVKSRHLALTIEGYKALHGLGDRSRAWLEIATGLAEECVSSLLRDTGVSARDIGQLTTTTVTGIAVPSIDARLMNRLPFDLALKRVPLFGLGCLGGAAGLARTAEYLRAYPDQLAVMLAVELCSLTMQYDDASVANVVSSGLFGDGAAAVLLAGPEHPLARQSCGPCIADSRSAFFPDTERVMGWDLVDGGFKVVLSPDVPEIVGTLVPPALDAFLGAHGLTRADIATWISHPGGPKVLNALEDGLGIGRGALDPSRESLARIGNLSSASVLWLLDDFVRRRRPPAGSYGILMAMGPAFCAELVLLVW